MRTMSPSSTRVPSIGSWAKTVPSSTSEFGHAPDVRNEPFVLDVLLRERLRDADDVWHRDRVFAEPVLERAPEEESADEQREQRADAREPRPERAASRRRLVLRLPGTTRDLGHRGRVDSGRASEDEGCCIGRLGRDATSTCDGLEVGVHRRGRLVAVGRLLGERADDDEVEVIRDLRTELGGGRRHLRDVLHRDLDRAVAGERNLAGQELEENDPGRVQVGRLVDWRSAGLLGREVLRGAHDCALLRHLARARSGDPEVRHLDDAFRVDDHVVGLDVAVDDAVSVRVSERGENLTRVGDSDRDWAQAARADELLQRAPLDVLHDDVVGAVVLAAIEDRDDVRVGEAGCVCRLAPEALDELVVVRVPRVQDLDRDPASELLVLGEVHVGHAAAAELPRDAVAPCEERSGEGVLGRHGCRRG